MGKFVKSLEENSITGIIGKSLGGHVHVVIRRLFGNQESSTI